MKSAYTKIEKPDLINAPEIVEEIVHWIDLLGIETVLRRDQRDGAYVIITAWENAPDIFIEVDHKGRMLTIYSNILTNFSSEEDKYETFYNFLVDVYSHQSKYNKVRACLIPSEDQTVLKILYRLRASGLGMEYLSEIVRETVAYLKDLQNAIEERGLPEDWRELEGEPKLENIKSSFFWDYT
ncbi:MAG: hypothetical protein HeimC3_31080 [Candidatus Heimdallarchaeota archaeon LC_3]|nr:MAG: hypothetical protein HeimC3_31080 [Candidatus Heimdallarchaeota archaeon LC_3]